MSIFSMILGIVLYLIALDKSQDNVVPAAFACVFGVSIFSSLTNTDTSALIVT